jgi:RNA polymerase sigma-70 factor (ECF subfamily)
MDAAARASFEGEAMPYLETVFRFAVRLTGSEDDAKDLTQDTFLQAYRAWHQFTPGTRCKSWLFTICRNLFLRERAREKRYEEIVAHQAHAASRGDEVTNPVWASVCSVDPEGTFFNAIVDERIVEAVDALDESFRTSLILSDVEGLSYHAIAEVMDVPVGTVKSRLFRARRQLQTTLYDHARELGYVLPKPTEGT